MKILFMILFSVFLTSGIRSQLTLDSTQVSKLIIKLNERVYLLQKDSLSEIELSKKDTLISDQEKQLSNKDIIIGNYVIDIGYLRAENVRLKAEIESKWGLLEYGIGSVLILIIGILAGLQL